MNYHSTEKQVIEALKTSGGFQSQAAKKLNISGAALCKRISKNPKLQQILADIKESYLDLAESKLVSAIHDREPWAICFYLKCQGKKRGYIEKTKEEDTESELPKSIKFEFVTVDGRGNKSG